MQSVYLILHNIRSTHNVGSILRTADAAGVREVYICGCTPSPIDRFGRKRNDIAKTALGAEEEVFWKAYETSEECIQKLKKLGVCIVAVEQHSRSVPYTEFVTDSSVAFVLGEETEGLPEEIIAQCDKVIEIPMFGKKESLNVSVAAGVVLFNFINKLP
jgi:23S rRNA (guanosine2251-2'-O)-methyltransferase